MTYNIIGKYISDFLMTSRNHQIFYINSEKSGCLGNRKKIRHVKSTGRWRELNINNSTILLANRSVTYVINIILDLFHEWGLYSHWPIWYCAL